MCSQRRGHARSYAELRRGGIYTLLREARSLYAGYARRSEIDHIDTVFNLLRELEQRCLQRHSIVLEGLDILDVGTGQHLIQLEYFAARNRVVGIDLDVIAHGFHPLQYISMLRCNGPGRTLKTITRKALGIDIRHARALRTRLGASRPKLRVLQMDACSLTFDSASFDFVFCSSVFHHLLDPARALEEIGRVLRPGGVACIGLQLYTSDTGSRNAELMLLSGVDDLSARWPHLRSRFTEASQPENNVNGLRLTDWLALFESHWPGFDIVLGQPERSRLEPLARELQNRGELLDYSIEELVTHDLWVDWQKPRMPD